MTAPSTMISSNGRLTAPGGCQGATSIRVALITGASRGIGAAIAAALRQRDTKVVGISRINAAKTVDLWCRCDVSDPVAVQTAFRTARDLFGRVDILVNCAGVAEYAGLSETSVELWQRTIGVNLTGTFLTMRAVLPEMLGRNWGRIINIASIAARRGEPQMAAYAASKHGILGLTRSAALQVAKSGVTINAVCPAAVDTDMLADGLKGWAARTGRPVELARKIFQAANPQNRILDPDEIAELVVFLTSDAARGINGQAVGLCGGALAC